MSENNNFNDISGAEIYLVPDGRDTDACTDAFQEMYDIEVPTFEPRSYEATTQGRTFVQVKGKDVPELIANGFGDVGITGSDSCYEYLLEQDTMYLLGSGSKMPAINFQEIGEAMCKFSLLAFPEVAKLYKDGPPGYIRGGGSFRPVVTSYPNWLRGLSGGSERSVLWPLPIRVRGKIEGMLQLTGVDFAADIVSTGDTAAANGLEECFALSEVKPVVVVKPEGAPRGPLY